jgi:hypothetical protein
MSALETLRKHGLTARADGRGGFLVGGMQRLAPDLRTKITAFARANKPRIVAELERTAADADARQVRKTGEVRNPDTSPAPEKFFEGGFRGEEFFPSEFCDPLFRLAQANGAFAGRTLQEG